MAIALSFTQQKTNHELDFNQLLENHHDRLYWTIRKWVVCHEDAKDVLQNTWIKVYRGLPHFRGESRLSTWLYRIAYNESVRFLKKKQPYFTLDEIDPTYYAKLANEINADAGEITHQFHRALGQLKEGERHLFTLKYEEEITFEEMSTILSLNVNTVKTVYYRAEKKVKVYLNQSL